MAERVLVVDDEAQITRVLRTALSAQGYDVRAANDPEEALRLFEEWSPDLIVTDLMMPGMSGVELCRRVRSKTATPIIVLSVRDQERSKVEALDAGADDYVTKPFSIQELLARVRAHLRRAPERMVDAPIEIGELRLEPVRRIVTKRGNPVHLTRKEFEILHCLMSRAGRVITYARLLTAVWGADCREEVEYLRTFVRQLRKKIEDDPSKPLYLLTDVYVGYRFADAQMFIEETAEGAVSDTPEEAS